MKRFSGVGVAMAAGIVAGAVVTVDATAQSYPLAPIQQIPPMQSPMQIQALTQAKPYRLSSGTGFFVSKAGDIVTNAHVVNGCDTVEIRGAIAPNEAKVVAMDRQIDLALLKTTATPPRVASFRGYGSKIGKNDPVLLIGYPEERALTGQYKVVMSRILDVQGPLGNTQWLQFEDAARQGNSGGPLLDNSGNVVGVITGKSTLTRRNPSTGTEEVLQHADVAVTLDHLKRFLDQQQVYYWMMYSDLQHGTSYIESSAKDYIVNIHCKHL
jgi:S1-C subfamily serine protease